jgi:NAD(P)-dependent dehydrogenase (short-subunit alcohol dehydrogenase family)
MREQLRAVVTGAGSGLGRALALEIASRGGRVVATDIDEASAAETAQQIQAAGGEAHVVRCDVGEAAQVDQLAETARALLGEIDLVANNAGVAVSGPFTDIATADWEWIMRVNLWGVIHGCRAFLPAMKARRRGYVINVASLSGLMSAPQMSPYNVTKSAVVALSETLYGEYRNHGVHVSVLCPSFFVTRIIESGRGKPDPRMTRRAAAFMRRSSVQAPEVARQAVDGVLDGQLYIVPMRHARVLWRMQRFWPHGFYRFLTGKLGSLPDLD